MGKVISTSPTFGRYSQVPLEMLKQAGHEIEIIPKEKTSNEEQIINALREADALIVGVESITQSVIEQLPQLKVIAKHGAGVDNIDINAASSANIIVANAPGANRHAVADYVFGLLLSLSRGIPKTFQSIKKNDWKLHVGSELYKKTIGVIGTGKIGTEVIRRAKGFNMEVLAFDPFPNNELVENFNINYVPLAELISKSDFITLHVDLTEQTKHLIGEDELRAMKKTSMLINTSRGGVVDEESLYRALSENWIRAAALDVFEKEPVGATPLLELENFIGTPHTAGYTEEALTEVGIITAQNVIDVLAGKKPSYVVNEVAVTKERVK